MAPVHEFTAKVARINTARCRRAGDGDCVAHVREAGDVGEGALNAEAEAGVRHRAVAAQTAPSPTLPRSRRAVRRKLEGGSCRAFLPRILVPKAPCPGSSRASTSQVSQISAPKTWMAGSSH